MGLVVWQVTTTTTTTSSGMDGNTHRHGDLRLGIILSGDVIEVSIEALILCLGCIQNTTGQWVRSTAQKY